MPYIAIPEFQVVRDKVRDETLDKPGTRWTDKELDTYINIAQGAYARRTRCLTGDIDVFYDGLNQVFQTPIDYIRAKHFNLPNSTPIALIDWKVLADLYTPRFLEDISSDIHHCYFNYESWNRFRFYPNPDVPAGTLLGTLTYARKPVKDVLEISNIEALKFYVLFRCYLKERNSKYLKKAAGYRAEFEKQLPKSKSRGTRTVTRQARKRSGSFF